MILNLKGVGFVLALALLVPSKPTFGQESGFGTRNLQPAGHLVQDRLASAGAYRSVSLDQSDDRNHAYVGTGYGWQVIDVSNPGEPRVLYSSSAAIAVTDLTYFRINARTFVATATAEGVQVFDVTDPKKPKRVAEVSGAGPAKNLFAYRHSHGGTLLIVTAGQDAVLYDAAMLVDGDPVVVGTVSTPVQRDRAMKGFEQVFAAYHADTETDRFYGAGAGGYHVYDISIPSAPKYLTSAIPAAVRRGHMVSVTPDGRFLLAGAEYRAAPLRIFDLQPALDGALPVVQTSVGAWTDDWTSFLIAHETRWPHVFVASGEQGLQVFNMRDPEAPYTDAYFRTSNAKTGAIDDRVADVDGAVAVDVRNSDGLIAVIDRQTGLWLLKLEGFQGWDGRGYGVPNVSSVQDWEVGPNGTNSY